MIYSSISYLYALPHDPDGNFLFGLQIYFDAFTLLTFSSPDTFYPFKREDRYKTVPPTLCVCTFSVQESEQVGVNDIQRSVRLFLLDDTGNVDLACAC